MNRLMLQHLIQNYYELHGNFDEILQGSLKEIIKVTAEESGIPQEEFCYYELGYRETEEFSARKVAEIRSSLIAGNYNFLEKLFCTKNKADLIRKAKTFGTPINLKVNQCEIDLDKELVPLAELLSVFYKTASSNLILVSDGLYPVAYWLESLKFGKNSTKIAAKDVAKLLNKKGCLVNFKVRKGIDPIISGKTFYSANPLTAEQKNNLQIAAIELVIHGNSEIPFSLFKNSMEILMLANTSQKKYLQLLDYATAKGTTYAKLLFDLGIKINDQSEIYQMFGILLLKVADKILVMDDSCTFHHPFRYIDAFEFSDFIAERGVTTVR